MRLTRPLLACGIAVALAASTAPAGAAPKSRVLATKRQYAGGSVAGQTPCAPLCVLVFAVRPGERWLHLSTTGVAGTVALDVKTLAGYVRVCMATKATGPLPIEGLTAVAVVPVLDDPSCGTPAATGTVLAYFSDRAVDYGTAVTTAQADAGRPVSGGF